MAAADRFQIIDAHTHFFSYTWLNKFYQLAKEKYKDPQEVADTLSWELPPKDPVALGAKWISEQDKYGLQRQVLFASNPDDAEFLAAALNAYPKRLIGYFMVNPTDKGARNQTLYSLDVLGMRGILLFPAMFHFHCFADVAYTIYEEAASASASVFLHFGNLDIPIFRKLGLSSNIDLSYSNPLDLKQPALDFPEINFIIPHFGCGRFEEALEVATACPNVYFDTSSSNSWIEPPLDLLQIFRRSLDAIGPQRLLFGTDSSFFPRGWRRDIFETQFEILTQLGLSKKEKQAILGGNIARILGIKL